MRSPGGARVAAQGGLWGAIHRRCPVARVVARTVRAACEVGMGGGGCHGLAPFSDEPWQRAKQPAGQGLAGGTTARRCGPRRHPFCPPLLDSGDRRAQSLNHGGRRGRAAPHEGYWQAPPRQPPNPSPFPAALPAACARNV